MQAAVSASLLSEINIGQIQGDQSQRLRLQLPLIRKITRACHGPTLVGRPGVGSGRPAPSIPDMMGCGPARPINFSEDGPRPGPAHHNFKNSRPGPSYFQKSRPGPARHDPSHGSEAHETRALHGPVRQLRGPARRFHGPAHVLSRTKRCICIR